ncbi:Hypothetical predicted protein [Cloeon dipterum]|uniref:Uncharacterized protein n=1 Tax=Cloeon dipterum TaxID=197152 RepID=A0A8S1DJ98_9INSE|nr:Hypothetical predicted protein [Cloeon dipterum]
MVDSPITGVITCTKGITTTDNNKNINCAEVRIARIVISTSNKEFGQLLNSNPMNFHGDGILKKIPRNFGELNARKHALISHLDAQKAAVLYKIGRDGHALRPTLIILLKRFSVT